MIEVRRVNVAFEQWPAPRRLAALRVHAGLSQREVAQALGVARITVAQWETGARRPERPTVARMIEFYIDKFAAAFSPFRWRNVWAFACLNGGGALLQAKDWARMIGFPLRYLVGVPRVRVKGVRGSYVRGDFVGLALWAVVRGLTYRRFTAALGDPTLAARLYGEPRLLAELDLVLKRQVRTKALGEAAGKLRRESKAEVEAVNAALKRARRGLAAVSSTAAPESAKAARAREM